MRADLSGKVAIVTGGSKGIGGAISLALAENGARVVVSARRVADGEALVEKIHARGGEAVFERADVNVYSEIDAMVQRVLARWGRVDVLVASGAPGHASPAKPFLETPPESIAGWLGRAALRIHTARAVVEPMARQQFGKIIFLSTDAGRVPTYAESLNGVAAAGISFFTRCLAMELARHGVRVYTVSTTLTRDTPGYDRVAWMIERSPEEGISRAFARIEGKAAFGLNRPEDIAQLCLFLASDDSNQISGATISINGGLSFPG